MRRISMAMVAALGLAVTVPARATMAAVPTPFDPSRAGLVGELGLSDDGRMVIVGTEGVLSTRALLDRLAGTVTPIPLLGQLSGDGRHALLTDATWLDLTTGARVPYPDPAVGPAIALGSTPNFLSHDGSVAVVNTGNSSTGIWQPASGQPPVVLDGYGAEGISADGRSVLVRTGVYTPAGFLTVVYSVYDRLTGSFDEVARLTNGGSRAIELSGDGRWVMVVVQPQPGPSTADRVEVHDRLTGRRLTLPAGAIGRFLTGARHVLVMTRAGVARLDLVTGALEPALPVPQTADLGGPLLVPPLYTRDGTLALGSAYDPSPGGLLERPILAFPLFAPATPSPRLAAGEVLSLPLAGRLGVPADAAAVALNVTVTNPAADGFVTVFPCGASVPLASNLNHRAGQTVPNAVIAKIGDGGRLCFYSKVATDLVVDVAGYFPSASPLTALPPQRLLDTRAPIGVDTAAPVPTGGVVRVRVAGRGGVPADAHTAVLNVTVADASAPGFVTVYPCDPVVPTTSSLNFVRGDTVPNAVVAALDASGDVCLFASASTDLVADVSGAMAVDPDVVGLSPARLLDTRIAVGVETTTPVGDGGVVALQVTGRGGVPVDARSVVLNVTVTEPVGDGFVTVYPCGDLPTTSSLNYVARQTVPNLVLASLDASGRVCLFTKRAAHLVVDVSGAFRSASAFTGLTPVRALDSRTD